VYFLARPLPTDLSTPRSRRISRSRNAVVSVAPVNSRYSRLVIAPCRCTYSIASLIRCFCSMVPVLVTGLSISHQDAPLAELGVSIPQKLRACGDYVAFPGIMWHFQEKGVTTTICLCTSGLSGCTGLVHGPHSHRQAAALRWLLGAMNVASTAFGQHHPTRAQKRDAHPSTRVRVTFLRRKASPQ
jgi:hypothetical protein